MKIKYVFFILLIALSFNVYAKKQKLKDGIYAKISTNKGDMMFSIEYKKCPLPSTVFIGLVEGTLTKGNVLPGTSYYNSMPIYQVNKDKFIILGDPSNMQNNSAGFYFHDQFDSSILHSSAGVLGFANQGPNTNSTQIYVTKKPMTNLDFKYTTFAIMMNGFDKLYLLTESDSVKKISIIRVGKEAQSFICNNETFEKRQIEQFNKSEAYKKQILQHFSDSIRAYYPDAIQFPSGLAKQIIEEGTLDKPCENCRVKINYVAQFENGVIFDKTDPSNPVIAHLGGGFLKRGLEEGIKTMHVGEKAILFIPYTLAYGELGFKDRIPPRANLIYEIELVEIVK